MQEEDKEMDAITGWTQEDERSFVEKYGEEDLLFWQRFSLYEEVTLNRCDLKESKLIEIAKDVPKLERKESDRIPVFCLYKIVIFCLYKIAILLSQITGESISFSDRIS